MTNYLVRKTSRIFKGFLEPVGGFEPSTYWLRISCSTAELHRPKHCFFFYHVLECPSIKNAGAPAWRDFSSPSSSPVSSFSSSLPRSPWKIFLLFWSVSILCGLHWDSQLTSWPPCFVPYDFDGWSIRRRFQPMNSFESLCSTIYPSWSYLPKSGNFPTLIS